MRWRRMAAGVLAMLALAGCGESLEGKLGEDLFRAGCVRCHGDDGVGGIGPAIGTADSTAALELSDEQIAGVIRVGPGRMPAFEQILTAEQIESLVVYLRELQSR